MTNSLYAASAKPKWDCPYIGYPVFTSTAARQLLQRAQERHRLEDCRIPVWMVLQQAFDADPDCWSFGTATAEDVDMQVQIDTAKGRVECWLSSDLSPPHLENVSLGGKHRVPTWEEDRDAAGKVH